MEALHACLLLLAVNIPGANYQTTNFTISAPSAEFAQQVGEAAEFYRRELAIEWLGQEMPRWSHRCPITCKVGDNLGAGGATSFSFDQGEVYGWKMNVEGSAERILDSVLPHEVNHTIFASYFRRPLPRWADEGAASLIEHESERMRLKLIHEQVMRTNKKIPLQQLLPMREYPSDRQQVLTLYAEGYSLADYLIQQSSKGEYLQFLSIALKSGWNQALMQIYGYRSVDDLERDLETWIVAGSPALNSPNGELLARSNQLPQRRAATIRAQSDTLPVRLGNPAEWPTLSAVSGRDSAMSGRDNTVATTGSSGNPVNNGSTGSVGAGRSMVAASDRSRLQQPGGGSEVAADGRLTRAALVKPALHVTGHVAPKTTLSP